VQCPEVRRCLSVLWVGSSERLATADMPTARTSLVVSAVLLLSVAGCGDDRTSFAVPSTQMDLTTPNDSTTEIYRRELPDGRDSVVRLSSDSYATVRAHLARSDRIG
jgi:hypothetical protein